MNIKTTSLPSLKPQQSLNDLVLSSLSKSNHLNHLKQLQSFLTTKGHSNTQFFVFKLIRFSILKLSNISYARLIFDHLPSPNIYLHAAMVTAYASFNDHASSFALFRLMLSRGNPRPNHFIFPHVLKNFLVTKFVHAYVEKSGFCHYPVVKTALVDSYSKSGIGVGVARELFDEIEEKNVVSWTAMVSGYAKIGQIEEAVKLFDEMPERDVASWNALISGCAQNGFFCEAVSLFGKMVGDGCIRPNEVTLVCALSACGNTGMLLFGRLIHGYAYRNGKCMRFLSNALVDMYGKCGSFEVSRRVFELSSERSLKSWNSMINCFALHGESEKAIRVFEEMRGCGDSVRPDGVTFVGLLNACIHGGLVEKGHRYFQMMVDNYGIEPQIEHYGCLIDILGRAGRFDNAMKVVGEMKMEPDEVIWGSLLNGCKIHGRTDLAEFAVKKLVEIDPNNGSCRTVLANLYKELGKWDDVRKVRKLLKKQSAYKTPGCSWIEADSQVCF